MMVMLSGVLCTGCADPEQPRQRRPNASQRPPAHVSYNLRVVFTDSTHTRAVLQAAEARVFDDRQQTELRDTLVVEFFSRSTGNRVAKLSADSAVIDDRTKNMTAYGDVRIWSDSSRTSMQTTLLYWDQTRQRVSTPAFVRIVSPTETIQGTGFESDQYLTSYTMYRVQGEHR
ncbi:MAG: LPS export ABC transporter periplasmic protein LptC [Candidatus Kapabacteria bacterium]|nr:LPS export ABC transporter periplasmic protein LptC [Candidatus Kapabacteria bacterium]